MTIFNTESDGARPQALARLQWLVGDWTERLQVPGTPLGRMSFEWALDGQFLIQRTEIPEPSFPDSIAVIAVAADGSGYTQHYFDSRGVVRTYAMTLDEKTWTLLRQQPDFTPLHFSQRFIGTLADDGQTIAATWETGDGERWRKDFDLTYARIPADSQAHEAVKGPKHDEHGQVRDQHVPRRVRHRL